VRENRFVATSEPSTRPRARGFVIPGPAADPDPIGRVRGLADHSPETQITWTSPN